MRMPWCGLSWFDREGVYGTAAEGGDGDHGVGHLLRVLMVMLVML